MFPVGFDGIRTRLRSAGKMHLNSDGHKLFIVRSSTLRTFGDYIALKIFTISKTDCVRLSMRLLFLVVCIKVIMLK